MTTRLLDRADWQTVLMGTDLGAIAALLPDETKVIVVEDDDGALLGCWSLAHLWQAEGLWIAPEARQHVAVARRLLTALRAEVDALGVPVILTGAMDDDDGTRRMLQRVGAEELPVGLFKWPMMERA